MNGKVIMAIALGMMAGTAMAATFRMRCDRADQCYAVGDTAKVTVEVVDPKGEPLRSGMMSVVADDGWTNRVFEAKVDLSKTSVFEMMLTRRTPGSLRIRLSKAGMKPRMDRLLFGVNDMLPLTPYPEDFAEFWKHERSRLDREVPIAVEEKPAKGRDTATHRVMEVSFATFKGRRVYGILAIPKEGKGPYPVCINVPGAGPGAITPSPLRPGWVTLTMNVHCFPIGENVKEHHARFKTWFAELKRTSGEPTYQRSGFGYERDTHLYHDAMLGMTRAIDWLAAQDYTDEKHFVYYGCSQGGGYGMYLTALWGKFAKSLILCPAMCDMLAFQQGRQPGSEHIMDQNPPHKAAALKNGPYYDACNFARQIHTPVRVTEGTADDNCQTEGVVAAFNAIASKDKQLRVLPQTGHGYHHGGLIEWVFAR